MANIHAPSFDEARNHPGFHALRSRLGYQLGSERLGVSLCELPPGQAAYPYHYHPSEEELLIAIARSQSLRTPDGWRDLVEGETVSFLRGPAGAHQLLNTTDTAVRFLAVSTNSDPDIVLYPDSNKLAAAERLPRGGGLRSFFRLDDAVDYWAGETPPDQAAAADQKRA